MKNRDKIFIGVTSITVAVAVILLAGSKKKKYKHQKLERLDRIAEEGYETAGDILYPSNRNQRYKSEYDDLIGSGY